jgi:hypothetical protein
MLSRAAEVENASTYQVTPESVFVLRKPRKSSLVTTQFVSSAQAANRGTRRKRNSAGFSHDWEAPCGRTHLMAASIWNTCFVF